MNTIESQVLESQGLTPSALRDIALGRGGTYGLSRDVIKHQIWDTRYFTAATVDSSTFFSQQRGAPWRNSSSKSVNETNMLDNGRLPAGQTFLIKRIGVRFISAQGTAATNAARIIQAFYNVMQSSYFELKIAGRDFDLQVHGTQFLPTVPVVGALATNNVVRVGDSIASGWYSLDYIPIFLNELVSFSVEQRFGNPDANVLSVLTQDASLLAADYVSMQLVLEGVLTRAK